MATGVSNEQLRQKALLYVFGKRIETAFRVDESTLHYWVAYETEKLSGIYSWQRFEKGNGLDKEVKDALMKLTWIAEGNEFPV